MIGASAAKRYGGKNILILAVTMWSFSTFITPFFASSIYSLIFLRVLLGIGEGLGELQYSKYIYRKIPKKPAIERGTVIMFFRCKDKISPYRDYFSPIFDLESLGGC